MLTCNSLTPVWQGDLERVQNDADTSENLVELVTVSNRIRGLPSTVQACTTNQRLSRLKILADTSWSIRTPLWEISGCGENPSVFLRGKFPRAGDGWMKRCCCICHEEMSERSSICLLVSCSGISSSGSNKSARSDALLCVDQQSMGSDHIVDVDDMMMLELAELCNRVGAKALELSAHIAVGCLVRHRQWGRIS